MQILHTHQDKHQHLLFEQPMGLYKGKIVVMIYPLTYVNKSTGVW